MPLPWLIAATTLAAESDTKTSNLTTAGSPLSAPSPPQDVMAACAVVDPAFGLLNFIGTLGRRDSFVDLGRRIEVTRHLRKMTQESCAAKAGISRTALRNLEEGNDTKLSTLWAVSNVLQIPICALFEKLQPQLEERLEEILKAEKKE